MLAPAGPGREAVRLLARGDLPGVPRDRADLVEPLPRAGGRSSAAHVFADAVDGPRLRSTAYDEGLAAYSSQALTRPHKFDAMNVKNSPVF